jgi:hypothetical protein
VGALRKQRTTNAKVDLVRLDLYLSALGPGSVYARTSQYINLSRRKLDLPATTTFRDCGNNARHL